MCLKELSAVFTYIFNKSLQVEHVPKVWKDAVVVPVPKSSSPNTLNDFSPVALTSILMKILDKLVREEILRKLNIHLSLCNLRIGHIEE